MMPKVLFLQTEDSSFWSHRLPMALAAKAAGYEVVVAAREGAHGERIRDAGVRFIPLPWRRSSVNPFSELAMVARIVRLYAAERPDLVHQVSAKPILYGTLAATLCGAKSCVEIAEFVEAREVELSAIVNLPYGAPSHDTFSRLFRLLDPSELAKAFTGFMMALRAELGLPPPRGVVAIDAKSLRRGYEKGRAHFPPLMVSVPYCWMARLPAMSMSA